MVTTLFAGFIEILGPVGAAKCLHILAPRFFPPWDTKIAAAYGLPIGESRKHVWRYWRFMGCIQRQYQNIGGDQAIGRNLIKALDEYNFCKHTYDWI